MSSPTSNLTDGAIKLSHAYQHTAAELKEARVTAATVEKYMIIGAVALIAIGIIVACSPAGAAAIIPFILSAPLIYGIYNLERVKTNIDDIIYNPSQVTQFDFASILTISADAVKKKLKENTFLFDWAIDLASKRLSKLD